MMGMRFAGLSVIVVVCAPSGVRAQGDFGDQAAITSFQRSVDGYAFLHRQVERRLGEAASQDAMAAGMRTARSSSADGDFFTPIVAAAFRNRIAIAFRTQGCSRATSGASSEVPRVGARATGTQAVPGCLLAALPRLPEELEYQATAVALILLDTHANLVVDVLRGAFPAPPP